MKNRFFRILLLLSTIAWFYAPCVASLMGRDDIITQTDVAVQAEISTITEEKVNTEIEKEWIKGWTTNVVNVREEPSEESRILKVWEECTPIRCYKYDNTWVAIEIADDSQAITAYIKSEYITENPIENEYRRLMIERIKAEDKKEWYLKYRAFIDDSEYEDKPETIYDYFSNQELNLLFRVVETETYQGDFNSKVNVADTVLARYWDERFGNTIQDIVTAPNQFVYGRKNITEDTILAVEYAFLFETDYEECIYFQSIGYMDSFNEAQYVGFDGYHYFYK